jgi:hypothetical protein
VTCPVRRGVTPECAQGPIGAHAVVTVEINPEIRVHQTETCAGDLDFKAAGSSPAGGTVHEVGFGLFTRVGV